MKYENKKPSQYREGFIPKAKFNNIKLSINNLFNFLIAQYLYYAKLLIISKSNKVMSLHYL